MPNHNFILKPSKIYCVFLCAAILASVIIVLCVSVTWWLKVILLALLAVYGGYTLFHYGVLNANFSVIALSHQGDRDWLITTNQGDCVVPVRGDSTVTPIVSILRFDIPEKKLPISSIVFKDSLPLDQYRQLVGLLRMG